MSRPRSVITTLISVLALLLVAMPALAAPPPGKGPAEHPGRGGGKPAPPPVEEPSEEPASLTPTDYIAQSATLSQPDYPQTATEVVRLPAYDGAELYLEITRPDPEQYGEGPWPVILEASPYHGTVATRIGDRMFPDPKDADGKNLGLTGYFAPRGYAVAMMDLRGTGRSEGCLDHLGPNDGRDLKTTIEWLADQDWSNGKVGMTGHSYVGSTPKVAAAQNPRGLATIVPSAGLASMYDHQFQKGVPWSLQWIGPMVAYEGLAAVRDLPPGFTEPVLTGAPTGDNWDNAPNPEAGCGMQNSAILAGTGQATGQYELWHAKRDHRAGATEADIPVFMIHGVHDNAARIPAAEWFFGDRFDRSQDKVWIGQWDHGSTNGRCGDESNRRVAHPTCRFEQMQYAIHAWFDKHLAGRDVDTGPPVEAFLNGESLLNLRTVLDPETWGTKVVTDDAWSKPAVRQGLHPDARDGSLRFTPPDGNGSASMSSVSAVVVNTTARVKFQSEPATEDTVFLGLPRLRLHASQTSSQISHLIATLYRQDAAGNREPINFCAIQPQLRYGTGQLAPVVPGEEMALPMSCFTMASWLPAGQSLVMEISSSGPHHVTTNHEAQLTIHTGPDKTGYTLPILPDATLHDDVPLRER